MHYTGFEPVDRNLKLASFPGSPRARTGSDGKLGGAWERKPHHILLEWFCTCAVVALGGAHLKSCLPDAQGTRLGDGL